MSVFWLDKNVFIGGMRIVNYPEKSDNFNIKVTKEITDHPISLRDVIIVDRKYFLDNIAAIRAWAIEREKK
jgi:hypothetical protein